MKNFSGYAVLLMSAVLAAPNANAASAEHGKAMFMQHGCWQCHGTQGQGSIATSGGKRLAPNLQSIPKPPGVKDIPLLR
jgi:cytochrome c